MCALQQNAWAASREYSIAGGALSLTLYPQGGTLQRNKAVPIADSVLTPETRSNQRGPQNDSPDNCPRTLLKQFAARK